jgi:hypothetical protein
LLFSCGSKSGADKPDIFTEKDFAETIELKGELMQFDSMIMLPRNIRVFDNLLFLQNARTDYHYQIFNLDTNSQINECVKSGRGPGEMMAPMIVNITDKDLWIYDRGDMSLYNYRPKDFISASNPEFAKKMKLSHNHHDVKILSDNRIIATHSAVQEKMFDLYDSDGKLLESRGEYPKTELSAQETKLFYTFNFDVSRDDKVFVTYQSGDIIEIHDTKTGTVKRRMGPNNHKPVFKLEKRGEISVVAGVAGETYNCYFDAPVIVGKEIFTMYYGDLRETFNGADKILVFDFKGNPLRIYRLNMSVSAFDVDPKKKIIYGITMPEEFSVVKFEY